MKRLLRSVMAACGATAVIAGSTAWPATSPAWATSYVPVSGAGSSWSANAINQWITDVQQYGMRINYAPVGSTQGRQSWLQGTVDFAASDIPFQTTPDDGSAPETPAAGSYAYMPITAGGTTFMYNLEINGQRVTNLRLSGLNIAKIFTGQITNWDNPALAADNPGLRLPNRQIVPVVRSDGSGATAQFTAWMINQYPSIWNAYCAATGRAPSCGETSFYPTVANSSMVAQNGDLGVAGYIAQGYADGAIGYVQYSYALQQRFPVAKMLNAAGYYTEPTPQNVAVSLLKAQVDTTDVHNPALYLTQKLTGVYSDTDPRTYPLSSYSYLILPTTTTNGFTAAKGTTLAAFSYYAMCQGQQESSSLGYSPMPINLVEASFAQITKIPGAVVQNVNIKSCNNPTFSSNGTNLLADSAPFPSPCDKAGPTQSSAGTAGDTTPTPVSTPCGNNVVAPGSTGHSSGGSNPAGSSGPGGSGTGSPTGSTSQAGRGALSGSTAHSSTQGSSTGHSATTTCDAALGTCGSSGGSDPSAGIVESNVQAAAANPQVLAGHKGWGSTQLIMLLAVFVFLLLLAPGLAARYIKSRQG